MNEWTIYPIKCIGKGRAQARTKRGRRAVSHRSEQKGPRQPAHAASPASRRPPTTSPVCRHPLDHLCCSALHSRPCGCGCTLPERPGWVAIANRIPHAASEIGWACAALQDESCRHSYVLATSRYHIYPYRRRACPAERGRSWWGRDVIG